MDNGLIFPYPCVRARDEAILLTTQILADQSFRGATVQGLRGTRVGSSQAMGVTQEGSRTSEWMCWGKPVGRDLGKSGSHLSLRGDA